MVTHTHFDKLNALVRSFIVQDAHIKPQATVGKVSRMFSERIIAGQPIIHKTVATVTLHQIKMP